MTDALHHRGPDASGYYYDKNEGIGLGHRRLSILDLREAANQPFHSQCGRYIMVYNGEVYNYKEIKSDLILEKNIQFKTTCDTEVILEAYAHWGLSFIERVNGMFAIAILDKIKNQLVLIRDRIGIKPIYFYNNDHGSFAFASEIKAFQRLFSNTSELEINYKAVTDFLQLGYVSGDSTIYKDIYKLKPGHVLIFSKDLQISSYWKLHNQVSEIEFSDKRNAKSRLKDLLIDSVGKRLISDVPIGSFLSGGIDSSLVSALAQSLIDSKLKTFTIGIDDLKYNESKYAREVARSIGSEHHELILKEKDAIEEVHNLVGIYDEPFADSSAIPTLLVSNLARKDVTVALSGDGGDEQFLGYGSYTWANRLNNHLLRSFRKPIYNLLKITGNDRLRRAADLFDYDDQANVSRHIFSQEQYFFKTSELNNCLLGFSQIQPPIQDDLFPNRRKLSPQERQAFFDLKNYLPEDLLVKVDRASMFHSLEIRVPLLDHRIVNFSLNLPESLKKDKDVTKILLKEILYEYVPKKIFDRPKWGFSIPLVRWLKGDLKFLIDNYLSEPSVTEAQLVSYAYVKKLKNNFFNGHDYLYNRLWVLIILHQWYNSFYLR